MDRILSFKPWPWLISLALVVLLLPAALAEDEKKEEPKPPEKAAEPAKTGEESPTGEEVQKDLSEGRVFTNEDLERLFGGEAEEEIVPPAAEGVPGEGAAPPERRPVEPVPGEAAGQPTDPLQWMQERQAREAQRREKIAEAEAAVTAAQQKVSDLEKRLLAIRNPYLARPDIPEEEKGEWDAMGAQERVDATEEQLRQAREDLQTAQQELARLRGQS